MSMWFRRRKYDDNFGIEAGQRFRAAGTAAILWEVTTVARYDWETTPHVRLHRVGEPGDAKTISLQVLRDSRFYRPAS